MGHIQQRLDDLNITLPPAPEPLAAYIPSVRTGSLLFTAGQIPLVEGGLTALGPVPSACSVEEARCGARQCAINGLAAAAAVLEGDLDRIRRVVRLGVFVASDRDFHDQPQVANGASEFLHAVFGESGRHVRSAVGCIALPLNASVEVEMTFEID